MKKYIVGLIALSMIGVVAADDSVCEYPECEAPAPPPVEDNLDDFFVNELLNDIVSDIRDRFENSNILPPSIDNPPTLGDN